MGIFVSSMNLNVNVLMVQLAYIPMIIIHVFVLQDILVSIFRFIIFPYLMNYFQDCIVNKKLIIASLWIHVKTVAHVRTCLITLPVRVQMVIWDQLALNCIMHVWVHLVKTMELARHHLRHLFMFVLVCQDLMVSKW